MQENTQSAKTRALQNWKHLMTDAEFNFPYVDTMQYVWFELKKH